MGGARGFTLVELIIVIVITGVIAAALGLFIGGPILGFLDQSRRAGLVDSAQVAMQRMGRDLRAALPNSIRTGSPTALELLYTLDGDRYRVEPPGTAADRLTIGSPDTSFNTLSALDAGGVTAGLRIAIYPLGQPGADPYADNDADPTNNVITPASTGVTLGATSACCGATEHRVVLDAAHSFPFDSPTRRVFLVQEPVSYLCDLAGRRLLRYSGYPVSAVQPLTAADFAAMTPAPAAELVTAELEGCALAYAPGAEHRNAVVTARMDVSASGETIRLLRQFHLDNTP